MKTSSKRVPKATRLRTWRMKAGLSLQEVSDLTGVSVAMISRAERGERSFAPLTRVRIARALEVPISDLFPVPAIEKDGDGA